MPCDKCLKDVWAIVRVIRATVDVMQPMKTTACMDDEQLTTTEGLLVQGLECIRCMRKG
jgi:aryl carrier-like protein